MSISVSEKILVITFQHIFVRSLNIKFCLNKMFINLCKFTECNVEHNDIALLNKFQYKYTLCIFNKCNKRSIAYTVYLMRILTLTGISF